ncbi:hypothetical protein AOLI_G00319630 [Acnodon oligacanthus]
MRIVAELRLSESPSGCLFRDADPCVRASTLPSVRVELCCLRPLLFVAGATLVFLILEIDGEEERASTRRPRRLKVGTELGGCLVFNPQHCGLLDGGPQCWG